MPKELFRIAGPRCGTPHLEPCTCHDESAPPPSSGFCSSCGCVWLDHHQLLIASDRADGRDTTEILLGPNPADYRTYTLTINVSLHKSANVPYCGTKAVAAVKEALGILGGVPTFKIQRAFPE